jgi:hypothetical protein
MRIRTAEDLKTAHRRILRILAWDEVSVAVFLKHQLNNGQITRSVEPAHHLATNHRLDAWHRQRNRSVVGVYDLETKPTYIMEDLMEALDELTDRRDAA